MREILSCESVMDTCVLSEHLCGSPILNPEKPTIAVLMLVLPSQTAWYQNAVSYSVTDPNSTTWLL